MGTCTLCELPTPDTPVTEADVDGEFCCRGCLEVYRSLGDVDVEDVDEEALGTDTTPADDVPESAETAYLSVEGLHCATCELFIESVADDIDGVYAAEASYSTDMARVHYDPDTCDPSSLPDALSQFGYYATEPGEEPDSFLDRLSFKEYRSVIALLVMMPVMAPYLLFVYPTYLGIYPRSFLFESNLYYMVFVPLFVWSTIIVAGVGYPYFRGAYVSLRVRQPNMDVLIALAVSAAYLYSTVSVFLLGSRTVYFDVAVMILAVVTVGDHVESRVKERALDYYSELAESRVTHARLLDDDGATQEVPLESCGPGDRVLVRPGERVPVDGTVVEGTAAVDESVITGESVPVPKSPGSEVIGGSIVTDNAVVVEVGDEGTSTLDRLVELLWSVQSSDAGIQRLANRFALVFVPVVIVIAVVTTLGWVALGRPVGEAILIGVSVLVVSCPCSLGIATPLALTAGTNAASSSGMLVFDGSVFERIPDTDTVAFDKTGTLTTGEMAVVDVVGDDPDAVLRRAAAVEQRSSHPVGKAILAAAPETTATVTAFERNPRSVAADVDGDRVLVGHPDTFDAEGWTVPERFRTAVDETRADGKHPTVVGWNGTVTGVVALQDTPRDDWQEAVAALGAETDVVVITGDDERVARQFEAEPAVDEVFAEVRPEAKRELITRLQADGEVTMVGDGTNDAAALASADLGVAMAHGTELTIDAADAVVTGDELATVPEFFDIADRVRRRIRQNLVWAVGYNVVAIPLAVAGLVNPLIAAVLMAASSLIVVSNSRRSLV
ncbi:P-type transport ATPase (probable substrate copper/metal cation) [Natronomonas pharaonis DSM 2160]|uniref:P-type transport ATPase (Probable substrate copper/metal cation) n=1 Tax=Natronomonas pharaonis (strain ATCC 35678 / DSM 2160 / CIP 103997 / JCM 8858 / NBRC 14720 / NCIMB 2260 / Gabara) TaxID=348780 RepID=A0A1U7EX22_NATPD|nr:cation-translocating P-type ATPase [Natronomonas pharaonis]CAI49661.1 P-type transport ATPase (probable substrate copper/metal cation) [Natronomonas pharaonis DSM 2160]